MISYKLQDTMTNVIFYNLILSTKRIGTKIMEFVRNTNDYKTAKIVKETETNILLRRNKTAEHNRIHR